MIRVYRAAALVIAALVHAHPAIACGCVDPGPPCEAFWNTPVVFVGRVEAVIPGDPARPFPWDRVRFRVTEQLRGPQVKEIELLNSRSTCGLGFRPGADWLIYASRFEDGRPGLFTSVCSRSAVLQDGQEDVEYARSTRLPSPAAGRIFGRLAYKTRFRDRFYEEPVGGVRITFAGTPRQSFSTTTDRKGRYEVRLPAGKYRMSAALPRSMSTGANGAWIPLADNHACTKVDLLFDYPGHLTGRVLASSGEPVPNLPVELMDDERDSASSRQRALTDVRGRFRVSGVAPGRYVPAVAIAHGEWDGTHDGIDIRYAFPGGAVSKDTAVRTRVAGASQSVAGDIVLPATAKIAQVTGRVLYADGRPASGVKVRAKADFDDWSLPWVTIRTDSRGVFALALMTGTRYRLVAENDEPFGSPKRLTATLKVDPSTSMEPPQIVLR